MKSFFKFILFVLVLSMALAGLYNLVRKSPGDAVEAGPKTRPEVFTPAEQPQLQPDDVEILARLDAEYTRLVEAVTPSVVSINTSRTVRMQVVDPFEMFFGRRGQGRQMERQQTSLGSGAIVSEEGHILTNNHVIDSMEEISVLLSDGRRFDAEVIGADPETDIAVLKIQAEDLVPLPIGDSDAVRVGQMVFAVGNPFGLEESVTQGIISAIGRRTMSDSANEYLQTDTAINPGNSGGPLVNLRGEIVGVNNHIYTRTGGYQGIGFAIPSNVARRALDSVIRTGRVVRGYLGVVMQVLTPELAGQFGLEDTDGALVSEIREGSPAEQAGIRPGDIIREFDGNKIKDILDLRKRVTQTDLDREVEIQVHRAGTLETLVATIQEMPTDHGMAAAPRPDMRRPGLETRNLLRGVAVRDLTPNLVSEFGLPENIRGVQVAQVEPGVPAAQVLRPGDVIEEIDRHPVESVEDFQTIAQDLDPDKQLMLFICRQRTRSFVMIQP